MQWRDLVKKKRRYIKLGVLFLLVLFLLTACGRENKDYEELTHRLENLEKAYNELLIEAKEWLQLSEIERELFLEKLHENESIEENSNQENIIDFKNDNEDTNSEGYISLQELLLEAEKYNGEFVRLSSKLRPSINNVDRKSFSTVLATGPKSWENDNSFRLEVFYGELEDWKDFGTMTLERDSMVRVEGIFYIYANETNRGYLEARKIDFIN